YRQIQNRPTVAQIYKKQLVEQGYLTQDEADGTDKETCDRYEAGYTRMVELEAKGDRTAFSGSTAVGQVPYNHAPVPTGISRDLLQHVGKVLTTVPEGFNLHPTLAKRFIPRRIEALQNGGPFDWAFAESLAWGALLTEGHQVRLSGQDCRRGTFSQRHAVFYDSETRERYIPLENVS